MEENSILKTSVEQKYLSFISNMDRSALDEFVNKHEALVLERVGRKSTPPLCPWRAALLTKILPAVLRSVGT